MGNFKRFLSLILASLMILSMLVFTAGAEEAGNDYKDAALNLSAIGVMKGDENGNLMLDSNVTRYQAALFFVQAITGKTDPSVWNADKSAIFSDVPEYGTAIDYLHGLGLILGRGNGIYGYNDHITYQDMLTLAVRTLGYEKEGMTYPYGYILEAQKLGLTENIDKVNYKAYLNRGETAQLIWDMLSTEIAITDPISGELVYPGKEDESAYGLILGPGKIQRETYLEKSGFASGKLTVVVDSFTEGKNDEADTVNVTYGTNTYVMNASDLGISKDTNKIDYLGLPKTLFVNCKAEEFFTKYNTDAEESEAKVVFANADELTFVENIGDDGNIRYVASSAGDYITLGGVKFTRDKHDFVLYTFTEEGWKKGDIKTFKDNFLYDTKKGYIGNNSYGALRYIVREENDAKTLSIYYTPYEFGQYFVRTLKDATTSKDASFTTLAKYESVGAENLDGVKSSFVEYLVGTSSKVTSATTTVSKRNGEKAKAVKLSGVKVASGDFVFYYYNQADNTIHVAENCGGFKTGALTSTAASLETVKIGGTTYTFGFGGAYNAPYASYSANEAAIKDILSIYESGKHNVKYVTAGGNVVFAEKYEGENIGNSYGFAVVTLDKAILADLLGVKEDKLQYTADFVLDEKGNVRIAVLNTESGEWELKSLGNFSANYSDVDNEYKLVGHLGTYAQYAEIAGENFAKIEDYKTLKSALLSSKLFAVIEEKDGVLSLGTHGSTLDSGKVDEGLIFSDNSPKTNPIVAEANGTAARVTLNENTVIVIIDGDGNIGIRRGVQKAKYSVKGEAVYFAANSSLILAYIAEPTFEGGFANANSWGEASATATTETYYAPTSTSSFSYEVEAEGTSKKYTVTVTNLLDLRTLEIVDSVSFETETVNELDLTKALYRAEDGSIENTDLSFAEAFKAAQQFNAAENNISYTDVLPENVTFTDGETVIINGLALPNALAGVNANVVTIDRTGLDRDIYDFDRLALNVEYADGALGGNELEISQDFFGYEYQLLGDTVEHINEPAEGVLDQFIINSCGKEILVPLADVDTYEGAASITVELKILAHLDEDTGILTLNVAKILK